MKVTREEGCGRKILLQNIDMGNIAPKEPCPVHTAVDNESDKR